MYKIIAICGEAGSGKDRLLQEVIKIDQEGFNPIFNPIISCTTRPKRDNEIEGKNYFYLTDSEFQNKINNNEMLEYTKFRNWYYGTCLSTLREDKINIGVFNPEGIEKLRFDPRVELIVYRIAAAARTRLMRQLKREYSPDIDEIFRRYKTDEIVFSNLDFDYIILPNETENDLIQAAAKIAFFSDKLD